MSKEKTTGWGVSEANTDGSKGLTFAEFGKVAGLVDKAQKLMHGAGIGRGFFWLKSRRDANHTLRLLEELPNLSERERQAAYDCIREHLASAHCMSERDEKRFWRQLEVRIRKSTWGPSLTDEAKAPTDNGEGP